MFSYLKDNIFNRFKRRELEKKGLLQTRKRMKQGGTLGTVFEKSKTVWIFILLAVWIVCVGVMLFPDSEDLSISFVENQQATSTVFSEFDFSYMDAEKTRIRRENAVSEEPVIYKIDAQIIESLLNLTSEFFEEFAKRASIKEGESYILNPDSKASMAVSSLSSEMASSLDLVLQTPEKRKLFMNEIEAVLSRGVIDQKEIEYKQLFFIRIADEKGRLRKKPVKSSDILFPADAVS
ncbi:MAG: hypothetical protein NT118_04725 [Lentisphaerae bacterium]|nr:hypothetical protein [Lentisphaerota bacterium]